MLFPLKVFTLDSAIVGRDDRYRSSVVGRKFSGWPKGVYVGFVPTVLPPSPILTLSVDPTEGYSLAKLPSSADPSGLDIILTTPLLVDLTPVPTFPVYVTLRAAYYDDAPPVAELVAYSTMSTVPWNEVLVCVVNGPIGALVVLADPNANTRHEPLALSTTAFGFMPSGSIELLAAATDMVNEVVAARIGINGTPYSTLSSRIAADYGTTGMASRLGLVLTSLRSNDYSAASGVSQLNVSGTFSEVNRDFNPKVTLSGLGSETVQGAVAAPADSVRNVGIVVNTQTGGRLIDTETSRNVIFGRIDGPTVEALSGTLSFITASVDVSGVDTSFGDELQVGDTIEGKDGRFYEVLTILDDSNLILRDAYVGPTDTFDASSLRRWTLRLRKLVAGVESAVALPSAATLRFFFPAFFDRATAAFDNDIACMAPGTAPPLPLASTTVPGRVQLGAPTSLVGAVLINNIAVPLVGGPFHTINFTAGGGQIVQPVPGEVTIGEIGAAGGVGPPGAAGAPGPPGPTGPGYSVRTPFSVGTILPVYPLPYAWSITRNMGHTIKHVTCSFGRIRDLGTVFLGDFVTIDTLVPTGPSVTATGVINGDNEITVFFSSAG
jgi:hypothetical protein